VPPLRTADRASRAGRAFDVLLQALPEIDVAAGNTSSIQERLADGVNQPAAKKPEPQKKPDFERSLARLEEVVRRLESPQLSLDEAMKLFEEGVGLSRECQKQLEEAEGRVEILLKKADGKMAAEPFEAEGESES
jgi:exodeoxyribonuclease VII small subunit